MKQRMRQPIPASSRRFFFSLKLQLFSLKFQAFFLPISFVDFWVSEHSVPKGHHFNTTILEDNFPVAQTPITPNQARITPNHPDSFTPKCFKRNIVSALECFIDFLNCLRFSRPNFAKTARKSNSARRPLVCPIPHSA